MLKICKTCANSEWRDRKSPVPEVCISCAFGADGQPTNWKEKIITNGDRVRVMCDGELAELFAAKVIDQVALMAVEAARPISGVSLAAMKDTYRQLFFSWLRSPAEEVVNG